MKLILEPEPVFAPFPPPPFAGEDRREAPGEGSRRWAWFES
jgi:hypothetical protein